MSFMKSQPLVGNLSKFRRYTKNELASFVDLPNQLNVDRRGRQALLQPTHCLTVAG